MHTMAVVEPKNADALVDLAEANPWDHLIASMVQTVKRSANELLKKTLIDHVLRMKTPGRSRCRRPVRTTTSSADGVPVRRQLQGYKLNEKTPYWLATASRGRMAANGRLSTREKDWRRAVVEALSRLELKRARARSATASPLRA